MSIMLVTIGFDSDYAKQIDRRTVPEKIMSAVVAVNMSSGTVIYSDTEKSLVLTAYHNVKEDVEKECLLEEEPCAYETSVLILHQIVIDDGIVVQAVEQFEVAYIEPDPEHDMAIIEIKTNRILDSMRIAVDGVHVGDDIYLAGNPQRMFRSLKKGLLSSLIRPLGNVNSFEISGGTIFGSSGGAVVNMKGELLGVIKAVRVLSTGHCFDLWDDKGEHAGQECVDVPIPFIGFSSTQRQVRNFLLNSVYQHDFNYLR